MKHVTFELDGERFAIPTAHLREILEPMPVTRVPNASPFSVGLINVRGAIVPLIDLRVALRIPRAEQTDDTRMMVLDVVYEGEPLAIAMIADAVRDVLDIDDPTEAVPQVGSRWPPDFVKGVLRHGGQFVTLPNLDRIFDHARADTGAAA